MEKPDFYVPVSESFPSRFWHGLACRRLLCLSRPAKPGLLPQSPFLKGKNMIFLMQKGTTQC